MFINSFWVAELAFLYLIDFYFFPCQTLLVQTVFTNSFHLASWVELAPCLSRALSGITVVKGKEHNLAEVHRMRNKGRSSQTLGNFCLQVTVNECVLTFKYAAC